MEDAINQYLSKAIEESPDIVTLFEVPDEEITSNQKTQMDWADQLSKEDFFIHSEQG